MKHRLWLTISFPIRALITFVFVVFGCIVGFLGSFPAWLITGRWGVIIEWLDNHTGWLDTMWADYGGDGQNNWKRSSMGVW